MHEDDSSRMRGGGLENRADARVLHRIAMHGGKQANALQAPTGQGFLHALDAIRSRAGTPVVSGALWLVAVMTLQATLGILTLLNQVPIDLALTHQAVAIAVLTLAVIQAERLAARQPESERQKLVLPVGQTG